MVLNRGKTQDLLRKPKRWEVSLTREIKEKSPPKWFCAQHFSSRWLDYYPHLEHKVRKNSTEKTVFYLSGWLIAVWDGGMAVWHLSNGWLDSTWEILVWLLAEWRSQDGVSLIGQACQNEACQKATQERTAAPGPAGVCRRGKLSQMQICKVEMLIRWQSFYTFCKFYTFIFCICLPLISLLVTSSMLIIN